jgi:hypothetical protein
MRLRVESFWPRREPPIRTFNENLEEGSVVQTTYYPDSRKFKVDIIQGNGAEHFYVWARCTLDGDGQPISITAKGKRTTQSGSSSPENAIKLSSEEALAIITERLPKTSRHA